MDSRLLFNEGGSGTLQAAITRFFGSKPMATLGSIAFPMFILHRSQALEKAFPPCAMVPGLICVELPLARHGPIGQIFYKKAPRSSCKRHDVCEASVVQWQVLAKRIWGAPMPTSFFPPQAHDRTHLARTCFSQTYTVARKVLPPYLLGSEPLDECRLA